MPLSDFLLSSDLTWMRTVQNTAMPSTAIIYRNTTSSDGMGGNTDSWAAIGTVDARLLPPTGDEQVTGGQIASITDWFITVPQTTDVTAKDRIRIDGNRAFEVEWVNTNEWTHTAMRCRVRALNEESFRETQVAAGEYEYQFDQSANSFYLATI